MSADLWAAFGSPQDAPKASPSPAEQQAPYSSSGEQGNDDAHSDAGSWSAVNEQLEKAWQGKQQVSRPDPKADQPALAASSSFHNLQPSNDDDDDDFGDFEDAEKSDANPGNSLETSGVLVTGSQEAEGDLDDFGDFEDVEADKQEPTPRPSLPSTQPQEHNRAQVSSTAARTRSTAFGSLIDFDEAALPASTEPLAQPRKVPPKEIPILVASEDYDDDAWDDFGGASTGNETNGGGPSAASMTAASMSAQQSASGGQRPKRSTARLPPPTGPPPTNIPPPSVLLSALSTHLETLAEQIRVSIVETWEDDEADVQKHVEALIVAARVVAGRKLRWKRDNMLAQSMRIGSAGRPGGMKLAGVDRAESQREDREAAELARTWRENAGAIRTALAEATTKKPPALPALTENIAVRTAKPQDGALTATKCCVLCGLKREERAERVDVKVWDQFGEWWTEHWGHTSCREFWEEHEESMQQR